jgi:hypothetical protein
MPYAQRLYISFITLGSATDSSATDGGSLFSIQ